MLSPVRDLPALGLDVVNVRMRTRLDVGDGLADVFAVLDDGVAVFDVFQRELVADRNVLLRLQRNRAVFIHDPAGDVLAGFHTFDHDHRDGVLRIVQYEMNHANSWYRKLEGLVREALVVVNGRAILRAHLNMSQLYDLYDVAVQC